MKFVDRLGQVVAGATAQWIGPIRYARAGIFGPTTRLIVSAQTCDTCAGPLPQRSGALPFAGVLRFCSRPCRRARHHPVRFRAWSRQPTPKVVTP